MSQQAPDGTAPVPFRIDLSRQKKRAKALLKSVKAGDTDALARFAAHHRQDHPRSPADAVLADAQFVIARELGCPSWPRLRVHVAAMEAARAALEAQHALPALDGDQPTLHIRCGSDIREALPLAGLTGDFLEFSDPYCHGPVPEGSDLLAVRARFLAETYALDDGDGDAETLLRRLTGEAGGLARAAERYERVVLWFEHDSYDQLILARCLAQFAETGPPRVLEMVSLNHFPGSARFIGLGQLPPEAFRLLWSRRRPVTDDALDAGRRVWMALRRPDPRPLAALAGTTLPGLPDLPAALQRHLQELPWAGDGLSLTERLTLDIASEDDIPLGRIFGRLMRERDPLPWLGDIMFLSIARALAEAPTPPCVFNKTADDGTPLPWPHWTVSLTDLGRALLRGEADWQTHFPPERWVGGVRIAADASTWRWPI